VEESINMQARNKNYDGPILTEYETIGIIHDSIDVISESDPGPFMPMWQSSPVVPYYWPYNWDGLSYDDLAFATLHSMDTLRVVVNKVTNLPDLNDPVAVALAADFSDWAGDFIGEDEDASEPMSELFYPIINSINDVTIDTDDVEEPAVGVLALTFYWRDLITNILPPNSKGVIVVFENTCNQVFTYRIDGENAIYVGQGDQHDSKYHSLGVSSTLTELRNNSDSSRGSAYTGLPLSQDLCQMTLRVYPSDVMKNEYVTTDPVIFTVAAVLSLFSLHWSFSSTIGWWNVVRRRSCRLRCNLLRSFRRSFPRKSATVSFQWMEKCTKTPSVII
jgi:hypothetical protein